MCSMLLQFWHWYPSCSFPSVLIPNIWSSLPTAESYDYYHGPCICNRTQMASSCTISGKQNHFNKLFRIGIRANFFLGGWALFAWKTFRQHPKKMPWLTCKITLPQSIFQSILLPVTGGALCDIDLSLELQLMDRRSGPEGLLGAVLS